VQLAALQAELVAIKAESTAKVASLEETIGNLAHENALLKRRLYGNKTERSRTSELQLWANYSPARRSCRASSTPRSARPRTRSSPSRRQGRAPRPRGAATSASYSQLPH
jgi:Transposase C of IS166 homeodomain